MKNITFPALPRYAVGRNKGVWTESSNPSIPFGFATVLINCHVLPEKSGLSKFVSMLFLTFFCNSAGNMMVSFVFVFVLFLDVKESFLFGIKNVTEIICHRNYLSHKLLAANLRRYATIN